MRVLLSCKLCIDHVHLVCKVLSTVLVAYVHYQTRNQVVQTVDVCRWDAVDLMSGSLDAGSINLDWTLESVLQSEILPVALNKHFYCNSSTFFNVCLFRHILKAFFFIELEIYTIYSKLA